MNAPELVSVRATGLPALLWRLAAPLDSIASTALGGGIGVRHWIVNAQVPRGYDRLDADAHLREIAAELGLPDEGVGFLTATDVGGVASAEDGGVRVDATVGLAQPVWAAAPSSTAAAGRAVGTVNVVGFVPVRLSPAALVNAVTTVTEGKAQALRDLGVDGTGTASDAVCVACPADGAAEPYCGPRSVWGARLARAVHAAVLTGAAREGSA